MKLSSNFSWRGSVSSQFSLDRRRAFEILKCTAALLAQSRADFGPRRQDGRAEEVERLLPAVLQAERAHGDGAVGAERDVQRL